jgi:hypothetical protein
MFSGRFTQLTPQERDEVTAFLRCEGPAPLFHWHTIMDKLYKTEDTNPLALTRCDAGVVYRANGKCAPVGNWSDAATDMPLYAIIEAWTSPDDDYMTVTYFDGRCYAAPYKAITAAASLDKLVADLNLTRSEQ